MRFFRFFVFGIFATFIGGVVVATEESDHVRLTSKNYVDTTLGARQDIIPAQSGAKAVTTTSNAGEIAPRDVKTNLGSNTNDAGLPTVGAVNTALNGKQDEIPAVNANTAITYTGTAGEIGRKGIYQDTGTYNAQQDNLIDAGTFNAALKNGLDNEFVCVDRDPDSGNCWLWKINNETENKTKNLLNDSFMDKSTYGDIIVNGVTTNYAKILPTENGKTYTLSATLVPNGTYYYYLREINPDGTVATSQCPYMWTNYGASNASATVRKTCTFTTRNNATYIVYFAASINTVNLTDYQMEEGSTATSYVPYGNVYIPQNQSAQNQ